MYMCWLKFRYLRQNYLWPNNCSKLKIIYVLRLKIINEKEFEYQFQILFLIPISTLLLFLDWLKCVIDWGVSIHPYLGRDINGLWNSCSLIFNWYLIYVDLMEKINENSICWLILCCISDIKLLMKWHHVCMVPRHSVFSHFFFFRWWSDRFLWLYGIWVWVRLGRWRVLGLRA